MLNDGAAIYSFGSHRGIMRENLAYGIHFMKGHTLRIAYYPELIDAVRFEEGERVFEAAGVRIDMRDAGPRK